MGIPTKTYFTTEDGAKIYYTDQGHGSPLVFVHGWLCSSRFWSNNIPTLAEKYRVIALDLRGHGYSTKVAFGNTISQYAKDIRELIKKLDLQNVNLVGWSMGGPVVLSYWEQFFHNHRLNTMTLIDISPAPLSSQPWNTHSLRENNLEGMINTLVKLEQERDMYLDTFIKGMFSKDEEIQSDDYDWILHELRKTPVAIALSIYSDNIMSDHSHILQTINIPTIVFGANSRKRVGKGMLMAKFIADSIPDSEFHFFEDAGHMLFHEKAERFNTLLMKFINDRNPD